MQEFSTTKFQNIPPFEATSFFHAPETKDEALAQRGRAQGVVATILYARVSTVEQTVEHQLAHAKAAGFTIDEVIADNGVSGLHSRLVERPEGRRLFDKLRAGGRDAQVSMAH